MLENLLKTWTILAPDEIEAKESGEYALSKTAEWNIYSSFFEEAYTINTLQGYLQRCIEARKWDFEIRGLSGYLNGRLVDGVAEYSYCASIQGPLVQCSEKGTPLEALLTCHLEMLSSQRPITPGQWKHADGGKYQVECCCLWASRGIDRQSYAPRYKIEEQPDMEAQPYLKDYADFKWVYRANKDYGDRVFYDGDSGKWARLTSSFLGLKDDGRLRFEKVND
jgi:hypothetical protein